MFYTVYFVPILDAAQVRLSSPLLKSFGGMLSFLFAGRFHSRPSSSGGFFLESGREEHPQIPTDQAAPPLQTSVTSKFCFLILSALR